MLHCLGTGIVAALGQVPAVATVPSASERLKIPEQVGELSLYHAPWTPTWPFSFPGIHRAEGSHPLVSAESVGGLNQQLYASLLSALPHG